MTRLGPLALSHKRLWGWLTPTSACAKLCWNASRGGYC